MTTNDNKLVTTRRNVLFGVGAAGSALATGMTTARAAEKQGGQVTDAPVSDKTQERQSFYGLHQAGIVTPRPAAGMIASFHVLAETPADVERLFRTLSRRYAARAGRQAATAGFGTAGAGGSA
jgi:deferrochelatase/peroxidase EfeB